MMDRSTTEDENVLIIGSGATGLVLAQGLKKAGIKCTVFEKRDDPGHVRDWNMGLHWGAPVLRSLLPPDMWSEIQSVQVDPHVPTKDKDALIVLNAHTGDEIYRREIVDPFYRLQRSKLRALLRRGLDVKYSKELTGIEFPGPHASVEARFSDSSIARGRLVIGADGASSSVRKILLGAKAENRNIPYAATWAQSRFPAEVAKKLRSFHPLYIAGTHPENKFCFFGLQDVPDPAKPETWKFFFYISWPSSLEEQDATKDWDNGQRLMHVKKLAEKFADPWKTAFALLQDDHPIWYMTFADWDPGADGHRWDNHAGRVSLAGDAGHTMTYQRGQGLNHSLTDASNLVNAVQKFLGSASTGSQEDAINAYEEEMIVRAGEEVRVCTVNTELMHHWERFTQSPFFRAGLEMEVKE